MEASDLAAAGLLRRRDIRLPDGALARAVASGDYRHIFHDVYACADAHLDGAHLLNRAALMYAGRDTRLSCSSAALEWALPVPTAQAAHVASLRHVRDQRGLTAHWRRGGLGEIKTRVDVPVPPLEVALIEAFGCLDDREARRRLLIESVADRLVHAPFVRAAVLPRAKRRPELLELLDLVEGGSHSEHEIALLLGVIRRFQLPEPDRQFTVVFDGRTQYLDAPYPQWKVDVEADGRAWHFDAVRRAADLRRDAWLASRGWVVLRFLYEQVTEQPQWVADRIAETLAGRGYSRDTRVA